MRSGRLKDWLTIERQTVARDAIGGPVSTWTTWTETWGEIRSATGRERFLNAQTVPEAEYKCQLRWLDGLSTADRIVCESVTYDILHIAYNLVNREMTLDLKTGVRNV